LTFFSRNGNPIAESKIQELKDSIEDIDINNLTPIEALNKLNELKKIIEE